MKEAALDRYKRETARHLSRISRYRRTLSAPEWSEQIRRMEGGKRYRFDFAPYQREMMETPFRQDVQLTAYMLASRMGKTEVVMNIIGHAIAEDPRKILVMYPVADDAEKWSKETLMQQTVEPTPELTRLIGEGEGRRLSGNTILHKQFPGGLLAAFGANAPGKIRRAKGNLLFADEIDAIKQNEADEGDPLKIFWIRGTEYPDTIKIAASYPSVKGNSKIEKILLSSDFRVMQYPCEKCGEPFVMHRKQIRYDRDRPQDAWFECPINGCHLTDKDRRRMILSNDKWTPTRPFTGVAGFHGNGMLSPHPIQQGFTSHLHYVADMELSVEKAENREKEKRVMINTFDAETYQAPEEEKPDPAGLAQEAYEYLERVSETQLRIPAGVLVVTVGADVQGDRVECEFVGHGQFGQTWGLGYHVLAGAPTEPEVWQKVDGLLQTEFLHPCGKILKPIVTFIDSKYKQSHVLAFTVPRQRVGVFAIFGSTTLGKPIVSEAKKQKRGTLYEIGTHEAKSLIYQNAALRRDRRSSEFPHNYMHYPLGHGYTVEYFQRLLIEDVKLKKATDGNWYEFFEKKDKRDRNEPLDIRVYAMAAAKKLNANYSKIAKKYAELASQAPGTSPQIAESRPNFLAD